MLKMIDYVFLVTITVVTIIVVVSIFLLYDYGIDEESYYLEYQESQTCKVQDNFNYSHWCEISCGISMRQELNELLKCQNKSGENHR